MKSLLKQFWNDESGLSAVEYAIAGGLVVAGMVIAFTNLGTAALAKIEELAAAVSG